MKVHRATWHLLLGALALPAAASAQGFGLNEIGTCAIARGFANTSAPCRDASMVYWNPAALTTLEGSNGLVGVSMIAVKADFTQDTTGRLYEGDVPAEFPPHLFWGRHAKESKWAFGLGAYVPYGLTSQWGDDFPGRFSAIKASIQTIYVQPTVAYKITPAWSVGVGPIVGHSSLELKQAVDLSEQSLSATVTFGQLGIPRGTEFARLSATGDDFGYGFTAGLHGQLNEDWQFGARYLSKVDFEYEGDADFTQVETGLVFPADIPGTPFTAGMPIDAVVAGNFADGEALGPQTVGTRITHPAQVQAGFTYTGYANTMLTAEYVWLGWKSFKELPVNLSAAGERVLIEDYNNSSGIRLAADHRLQNGWALRLGTTMAASAAPPETVTPLLPEQDRYTINLGTGIPLTSRFALDLAYAYVGTWGSRGRIQERESRDITAEELNTGTYRLKANILSLSLSATY